MTNKNYIQIDIKTISEEQNDIVIALLADIGFEGFEEDALLLKSFIPEYLFNQSQLNETLNPFKLTYKSKIIEQQNWNANWENSFNPVIINDFVAVRANFHSTVKNVKYEIIITPKMSFGTGHHATTYLMIEQMREIDFKNKHVVDFGTGTGVLAILAQKMGAINTFAIDNDEWSINNAKENILENNTLGINLKRLEKIDSTNNYNVVLVNINLNVLLNNMNAISNCCNPNAIVLLSGFLISDLNNIQKSLATNNLIFQSFTQQKDWICVKAIKG